MQKIKVKEFFYFQERCKKHDLIIKEVNQDTLLVYSKKYFFDSWLIKKNENDEFELWHLNKKNRILKCSYHLHLKVKYRERSQIINAINKHNKYAAFIKNTKNINLVDRVLNKK